VVNLRNYILSFTDTYKYKSISSELNIYVWLLNIGHKKNRLPLTVEVW